MVETCTGIGWPAAAAGGGLDLQPTAREATTAQMITCKTRRVLKIWDTGLLLKSGTLEQLTQAIPYDITTARGSVQKIGRNHSKCTHYRVSGLDVIKVGKGSQKLFRSNDMRWKVMGTSSDTCGFI